MPGIILRARDEEIKGHRVYPQALKVYLGWETEM